MNAKQNIIRFTSRCPRNEDEQRYRAEWELKLIKEKIAGLKIEDYAISYTDRGLMLEEVGQNSCRWVLVIDYIIKPLEDGDRGLQNYIDWLTILSAKESDWVPTRSGSLV